MNAVNKPAVNQRGREGTTRFKNANFDERRSAAEAAEKVKLEKFRALSAQINEGAAERLTARQAIIAARDVRAAEREVARLATEARAAEDQAAREMALKAEQAERDASIVEQAVVKSPLRPNARQLGMPATPLERPANNDSSRSYHCRAWGLDPCFTG
jgi:hypothetical protein